MGWNLQKNRHFVNKSVIRSGPVAERGATEPIRTLHTLGDPPSGPYINHEHSTLTAHGTFWTFSSSLPQVSPRSFLSLFHPFLRLGFCTHLNHSKIRYSITFYRNRGCPCHYSRRDVYVHEVLFHLMGSSSGGCYLYFDVYFNAGYWSYN